jgi:uncharacterized membrane protein YhaH (DUF805 family)
MKLGVLLFSRRGRIPLATFWYYTLVLAGVYILINLIRNRVGDPQLAITITFISSFLWLLLIYPSLMVAVKRLHDCSRSGWFVLLNISPFAYLLAILAITLPIRYFGVTIPETFQGITVTVLYFLMYASYIPAIWLFLELGFKRGTVGDNQYGPDPRLASPSAGVQDPLVPLPLTGELLGEFPHPSPVQICPACSQPVTGHLSTCEYRETGLPDDRS